MGGAIAEGLLKTDNFCASDLVVSDHHEQVLKHFAEKGAATTPCNKEAARQADVVCVVVKPWHVEKTLLGIKEVMNYAKQTLLVVAAGVPSASILQWMDKEGSVPPLFLVMPNIAIAYMASATYITPVGASAETVDAITNLFNKMGRTFLLEEDHYPAATALSCSIAYAMRYARASMEAAVELGFKAPQAKDIVLQTMQGAISLLQATGEHPEAVIDKVTTPGGLTIRGLNEMEHAGFTSAVIRGVKKGLVK